MAESPKKLFKGQNTHPLSQAEKQAFWKKLKFKPMVTTAERKIILEAVKEMMECPTGREQIRKVVATKEPFYNIETIKNLGNMAISNASAKTVAFNKDSLKDIKETGNSLLHELLHQRQNTICDYNGSLNVDQTAGLATLFDSETMALSQQLYIEAGQDVDIMYKKAYEKNIEKWRQVADGKQPLPKNVPALIYEPNLTAAEKEQAKEEYAKLLASLECRGTATKEFVKPMNEIDENLQSYRMLQKKARYMRMSMREFGWKGEDAGFFKNPEGNPEAYQILLKDISARNPLFVMPKDLEKATISGNNDKEKPGFMSFAREAQERYAKGEGKNYWETLKKVLAEKEKKGTPREIYKPGNDNNQVYGFFDKEMYPAGKGLEGAAAQIKENEAIQKTKMLDDNQKIEVMLERIKDSKNANPEPCEERTDAIKRLQEMTGNPNLPIVKTSVEASVDSQVQEALRRSGKPVPPVEETSPCLTPDKSLMA